MFIVDYIFPELLRNSFRVSNCTAVLEVVFAESQLTRLFCKLVVPTKLHEGYDFGICIASLDYVQCKKFVKVFNLIPSGRGSGGATVNCKCLQELRLGKKVGCQHFIKSTFPRMSVWWKM